MATYLPSRPDEKVRILSANGWITEEKELYMARLHRMDLSHPVVRDKAQQVCYAIYTILVYRHAVHSTHFALLNHVGFLGHYIQSVWGDICIAFDRGSRL